MEMQPRLLLKSIKFSDGTEISTVDANIIALVGPNNSGKSSTLREIRSASSSLSNVGPVLKAVTFEKQGASSEIKAWLEQNVQKVKQKYGSDPVYSWLGKECEESRVEKYWAATDLLELGGILTTLINVENRLEVANKQEPIDFFSEAPSHPMHIVYKDVSLEQKVSEAFRTAFNADLMLNRGGGKVIAFHVGNRPAASQPGNAFSSSNFQQLCKLPFLHNQGHGMRSFAGCVLHAFSSPAFIHLIDEPEAFLHPPHAKLLAGVLARCAPTDRQFIIATHSGDFLRGLLDTHTTNLRVIRLTRKESVNHVHELDSDSIRKLWSDPILRFSNVLDAIFHDGVVICESDGDCRFYSAVLNAVLEKSGVILPDLMFVASGGKDRIPVLVRALRQLGVKIRIIADFDVLREDGTLKAIVDALNGNWSLVESGWRILKNNIQTQTPPLSLNQTRERITQVLNEERTASVSEYTADKIKQALKATSPWHHVKNGGINTIALGQPQIELNKLLDYLQNYGLFVVPCGEIERLVPTVGAHGPKWVAQALTRDLLNDPELESARAFIIKVFDVGPQVGWVQPKPEQELPPIPKVSVTTGVENNPSHLSRAWHSLVKIFKG